MEHVFRCLRQVREHAGRKCVDPCMHLNSLGVGTANDVFQRIKIGRHVRSGRQQRRVVVRLHAPVYLDEQRVRPDLLSSGNGSVDRSRSSQHVAHDPHAAAHQERGALSGQLARRRR